MKTGALLIATTLMVASLVMSTAGRATTNPTASSTALQTRTKAEKKLQPFRSEQELQTFFRTIAEERKRRHRKLRVGGVAGALPSPPASVAQSAIALAGADAASSITNVQHAGVDEGGIVKMHGDHLVALRRGRLFTIGIGRRELRPIAVADAYAADIDPGGTWYDEMLVSGDTGDRHRLRLSAWRHRDWPV